MISSITVLVNNSSNSNSNNDKKDNGNDNPHQYQKTWFEYYDTLAFPLSPTTSNTTTSTSTMVLRCMDSLAPLDMIDLSNGRCDATSNRVWMGAVFFMECMVQQLPPVMVDYSILQHSQREREREREHEHEHEREREREHQQLTSRTLRIRGNRKGRHYWIYDGLCFTTNMSWNWDRVPVPHSSLWE